MMAAMGKPFVDAELKLVTASEVVVGATGVSGSAESPPVSGVGLASFATRLTRVTAGTALGLAADWAARMSTTGTAAATAMSKHTQQNLATEWVEDVSVIWRSSIRSCFENLELPWWFNRQSRVGNACVGKEYDLDQSSFLS